jgi:hypothetical protein
MYLETIVNLQDKQKMDTINWITKVKYLHLYL